MRDTHHALDTVPLLDHVAEGPVNAPPVVLLHGFPDNYRVWDTTAAVLQERGYRVVRMNLPGFEPDGELPSTTVFAHTIARIHRTMEHTQSLGGTLIGHDWGAVFAYRLLSIHPQAASRLVTLEIGAGSRAPWLMVFVLFYQSLIIAASCLGRGLGDRLLRAFCRLLPQPHYDGTLQVRAHHGWLYRQAWREGTSHGPWPFYYRNHTARWVPPQDLPILFLYGKNGPKPLRFHTAQWRGRITRYHPESRSIALPGSHWFFLEHPQPFLRALGEFLPEPTP